MQAPEVLPLCRVSDAQTRTSFPSQENGVKIIQERLQPLATKDAHKAQLFQNNGVSSSFQQSERSSSDSFSAVSVNKYRALRRKYLLLEEEASSVARHLRRVKNEITVLEDEKLSLLDKLVVLEGLTDPLF